MSEIAQQPRPLTPAQALVARIRGEDFRQQVALALPPNVTPERFARVLVTAVFEKPEIAEADLDSFFVAAMKCAQDGLLPDGRQAAITAYNDRKRGIKVAQYLPMIGGIRAIVGEHGWTIRTRVVYSNDEFHFEDGAEQILRHVPVRPGAERGERIAAYAVATHRDVRPLEIKVMYEAEIAKHRAKAQTQAIWNEWPDPMYEKTVGKAIAQELPLDDDLAERLQRVLAPENEQREALAALYGPRAARALNAPAPAGDDDEPGSREASEPSGSAPAVDQQAEPVPSVPSPGAGSAPGDAGAEPDDEPYEPIEGEVVPDDAVEENAIAAGTVKVPDVPGKKVANAGMTLAEVHALPDGPRFLAYCLDPVRIWHRPNTQPFKELEPAMRAELAVFAQALRRYVDFYLPEMLAEGTEAA